MVSLGADALVFHECDVISRIRMNDLSSACEYGCCSLFCIVFWLVHICLFMFVQWLYNLCCYMGIDDIIDNVDVV